MKRTALILLMLTASVPAAPRSNFDRFCDDVEAYLRADPRPKIHPYNSQRPFEREFMVMQLYQEWVKEREHGSLPGTTRHKAIRMVAQIYWAEVIYPSHRRLKR